MTDPTPARTLDTDRSPTMQTFVTWLRERDAHPARGQEIDARIDDAFGAVKGIFVMDTSGFSRTTAKFGIAHFLSLFQKIRDTALPLIEERGGSLVKEDADNLFATFPDAASAVSAAEALIDALHALNAARGPDHQLSVSLGIGYGRLLLIDAHDMFGDEMNRACKLGEDLAGAMEILVTDAAFQTLGAGARAGFTAVFPEAGGLVIPAWQHPVHRVPGDDAAHLNPPPA